jgi:hypothetical protein
VRPRERFAWLRALYTMVPDMQQGRPYLPIATLMLLTPTLAILEALAAAAGGGYRGNCRRATCFSTSHGSHATCESRPDVVEEASLFTGRPRR